MVSVLLFTSGVFFYRDLWPLATFNLDPMDALEGKMIWIKVSILLFVGVVIPLVIPRVYTPFDPTDPESEPAPEQTASALSFATYAYLDPVISLAYSLPHLPADRLPPLADYDRAKNLRKAKFPVRGGFSVSNTVGG